METKIPKQKKPPVPVISKDLKEGSGSMKEPAVFWAVSDLTCLKQNSRTMATYKNQILDFLISMGISQYPSMRI